ncbi:hypothetical protein UFOVP707_43 [uncultured Caudovirales phage]|uniref:Uncharacterized protein n=1 Tax=uncultured Caudovirales phage TaxID=2100421 RepID=A0A6J5NGX6_9CAUD|nr:hypothetical protein UFOVP707_43 [uncultured Caudovirales phage]
MSNPYFNLLPGNRFAPGTKAKAEEVNARLDEIEYGFDLVKVDMDLKAPLASPAFTGTVIVPSPGALGDSSSKPATTAWIQSLLGSLAVGLPVQAGKNSTLRTNGTSASWGYLEHFHARDVKTAGTPAGGCGTNTSQARTLNTVIDNTIAGASLASNLITLPAGSYKVRAVAQGYACGGHRLAIHNVTASQVLLTGPNSHGSVGSFVQSMAIVAGVFTLAVTSQIRLDHFTASARATDGLGQAISSGPEIYADIELWRTE